MNMLREALISFCCLGEFTPVQRFIGVPSSAGLLASADARMAGRLRSDCSGVHSPMVMMPRSCSHSTSSSGKMK